MNSTLQSVVPLAMFCFSTVKSPVFYFIFCFSTFESQFFIQMAVEGMHDVTVLQLKILGIALARNNGHAESKAVSHLTQRISTY